ncbi:MAG: hypothetical protein OMOMHJEC_03309 [Xanthomonadales bacterium]|nr:hypothetical protein [Xanthomonadales bacterium]
MWEHGNDLVLGQDVNGKAIHMSADDRSRHMWVPGLTGSGKTSFIEGLVRQDIEQWVRTECGLCVMDPDGALSRQLVAWMADRELWMPRPLIPIDLTQDEWVIAFDVLRSRDGMSPSSIAQNVTEALAHCMGQGDLSQTPRFARIMESVALALVVAKRPITDAVAVLSIKSQRDKLIREVRGKMPDMHFAALVGLSEKGAHDETESTLNRLFRLLRNDLIRRMLSVSPTHGFSLDFSRALNSGAIVLINLNPERGYIQPDDAKVFGSLILSDLWNAVLTRGAHPKNKPFYLYVDELAQYASSPVLPEMLRRGRKFGLHMTFGTQQPSQLKLPGDVPTRVLDDVKAGCRTKVVFHLDDEADVKLTADMLFRDRFDIDERKHELETTKVVEYEEQVRVSVARGETRVTSTATGRATSEMQSDSQIEGHSDGLTLSQAAFPTEHGGIFGILPTARTRIRHDNIAELADDQYELAAQVNASRGRSAAAGRGRASGESASEMQGEAIGESYSETHTPTLVPKLGKELSSVTFRSLEEQRHRAMSSIQALKARMAWVRVVDHDETQLMRTMTIKEPYLGDEHESRQTISDYLTRQYEKLPFALRAEALKTASAPDMPGESSLEPDSFSVPADAGTARPRARRKPPA